MSIVHAILALVGIASSSLSDSQDAVRSATDLGITAEAMVCAGVSNSDATELLAFMGSAADARLAVDTARSSLEATSEALAIAESSLALEPDDPSLVAARDNAAAAYQSATAALATARQSLFSLAVSLLTPEEATSLSVVIEGAARRVPGEFRVVARSESDWSAIELALRAEARAIREGVAVPVECATLLASVRGEVAVSQAKERLVSQLASMKDIFSAD